ncbi:MAG: diguanylate cyclase [Campylobacter sp.]|nr:diguanylate cyclase [Campylobacter sp.]
MVSSSDERILIVEDNKSLAKLIAKKMQYNIEMPIDIAHTLAQTSDFLEDNKYFMALLDLNLPDAPNGEVVDFVLSKGVNAIVLTGTMDEKVKTTFMNKDIVDYVYKNNISDINYIFQMINRLQKNKNCKAMIIEDSLQMREQIKKILLNLQFSVFMASDGEEAMEIFKLNPDIKLIISDYYMPKKDGLEFLQEIRKNYGKEKVAVILMTSPSENVNGAIFLKNGANDFIAKPFVKEEMICRINNTIESLENIEQISNFADKDFLTGAYNRHYFYNNLDSYYKQIIDEPEPFAVAMLDIDNFKNINDTCGHESGDKVLKALSHELCNEVKGRNLFARFGGEEFCIVLKNITRENASKFFAELRAKIANLKIVLKNCDYNFSVSIGVSFANNAQKSIDELINLADKALYNAKEHGKNRVELAG